MVYTNVVWDSLQCHRLHAVVITPIEMGPLVPQNLSHADAGFMRMMVKDHQPADQLGRQKAQHSILLRQGCEAFVTSLLQCGCSTQDGICEQGTRASISKKGF